MELTISIIGIGNIGKVVTTALLQRQDLRLTLNLVDIDPGISGVILDLCHALQLHPNHHITHNSDELLANSDFIFHCAGASVPKGKSRLYTAKESIGITEEIFDSLNLKKEAKIIIVSNPVEIISTITQKITGLPGNCVVGTGTMLDSIRMDYVIKKHIKNAKSVHSVLLGEHGKTTFLSKQLTRINGKGANEIIDEEMLRLLIEVTKRSAETIKQTQDATIYGVSFCAIRIFNSFLSEVSNQYPVSTQMPEWLKVKLNAKDIYLSLFSNIDTSGVEPVQSYRPNEQELSGFRKSHDYLLSVIPDRYLGH